MDNNKIQRIALSAGIAAVVIMLVVGFVIRSRKMNQPNNAPGVNQSSQEVSQEPIDNEPIEVRDPSVKYEYDAPPDNVEDHLVDTLVIGDSESLYLNNKVLSAALKNNLGNIYVGAESPYSNGLLLNIQSDLSEPGHEIGYYVSSTGGELFYCGFADAASIEEGDNFGYCDFAMTGILFNKVVPSFYISDEKYGVSFVNDMMITPDPKTETITIRAYELRTGEHYGTFYVDAVYDSQRGKYFLDNLKASNKVLQNYYSNEELKLIEDAALDYSAQIDNIVLPETWRSKAERNIYIDKPDKLYFTKALCLGNDIITMRHLSDYSDIFAATLYLEHYGYTTVYLGYDKASGSYIGLAYDPLMPRSEKTLLAPKEFLD